MSLDWIPTGAARKIPAKERGNRGIFPSSKVPGGIVEYESCVERDLFLQCNHAPDVALFLHQPITIPYTDTNGKNRKYTPDAYIEFSNGIKGLFEVKYEEEILEKGHQYQVRWENAQKWCEQRKIIFTVLTERVIRTPRWFNVWFTLGSSKCVSMDSYLPRLTALIPEKGVRYDQLSYSMAEAEGIEITKAVQIICYAIYHGLVFIDSFSSEQLSNSTIIRKKQRSITSCFRSFLEELNLNLSKKSDLISHSVKKEEFITKPDKMDTLSFFVPEDYQEIVDHKKNIVKQWLSYPRQNHTIEWRSDFCNKWNVNERTIYRWIKAYKKDGFEGLIPNYSKSGRKLVYNQEIQALMEKARQYYLVSLVTLKQAYKNLEDLCQKNNIEVPPEPAFRTFIYKYTTAADRAKKRGNKFHKAHFTPSLTSFQGAYAPMQILQMDNTSLDVFPVDTENREGLSTPYMTIAMDCYSRMITGFSVSYFPSSSRTVLEVLVQSILPKDDLTKLYGTQQRWPLQGFPVLLLVDNGMDYRSQAVKEFCIKYDIIIEYAPIRTPRYKAYVEQWFNTLDKGLLAEAVSGFRPLLKQRIENPELKPEAEAVLTLQEIEQWLHSWIIDDYHFTNPYSDHVPAPYLKWHDFKDGQTRVLLPLPREPPNVKDAIDLLYLSVLEQETRTLSYEGIVWEYLKYNSKELSRIFNNHGVQDVKILVNNRDIRTIWVINPSTSLPFKVGLASGWGQAIAKLYGEQPINASAWKTDIKLIKNRLKNRISPHQYEKEISRLKREELLCMAKKSTKLARKAQEKVKETNRKSFTNKLQSSPDDNNKELDTQYKTQDKNEEENDDNDEIEGYSTDWDEVKYKIKWSNDFFKGDEK